LLRWRALEKQDDTEIRQLERRNAELAAALAQLQASEERWRTIVSTDPECVKTVSPEGVLIEMNPAGIAMLAATTLAQVKARPLVDWIAPEYREQFSALHQRVMAGQSGDLEFEVIGMTGVRRWLRTHAAPLRDQDGRITSVLAISRDITEQRELEAQLRQSQKMEAIGQLAGGIAHDFNNILTIIQGFASTLLDKEAGADSHRVASQHIVEASERAAGLTRQLLAFGRRQVMQTRDVDLNDLVASLAKMVQRVLGEDINLQLQLSARPIVVHADPGLIDQVLMNLVLNARDAMPGGGLLRIDTFARMSPAGNEAVIRVVDTGIGIPEERLCRIFDPFYTTKDAGKGSGLGLATAFGIMAQHGGRIAVSSRVGDGTTFEVIMPVSAATIEAPAERPGPILPNGGTETILLVEDEVGVRTLTKTILERAGYQVIAAVNGTEGFRAFQNANRRIDLVLTDIVMPGGMSGRDLVDQLLKIRPDLPVVFTSGYSTDFAGHELILKQGQSFVQKPSRPAAMLAAIRSSLDA
jgi:two-component system, cell cycle sensor histidine kinase and response regulator CckA